MRSLGSALCILCRICLVCDGSNCCNLEAFSGNVTVALELWHFHMCAHFIQLCCCCSLRAREDKTCLKGFRGKRNCTNLSRLQHVHYMLTFRLITVVFKLEKNIELHEHSEESLLLLFYVLVLKDTKLSINLFLEPYANKTVFFHLMILWCSYWTIQSIQNVLC